MRGIWQKAAIGIMWICILALGMIGMILTKKWKINPWFAEKYELQGIDVSHYQGTIDWLQIQEQDIDFAFIKATEGSSHVDECFYTNWQAAAQTELFIGAYHFFSFDSDAQTQARLFIDTVGNLSGKIAPVIDIEYYGDKWDNPPGKDYVVEQLGEMLRILEEYYQVKPIIYTTYRVYGHYIKEAFAEYPLWIRNVYCPPGPIMGSCWTFWQYQDTAVMAGYSGGEKYIDRNVFHGTLTEFEKMLVK